MRPWDSAEEKADRNSVVTPSAGVMDMNSRIETDVHLWRLAMHDFGLGFQTCLDICLKRLLIFSTIESSNLIRDNEKD
jgi:hypothetical protein